jgi:hypothetical protein
MSGWGRQKSKTHRLKQRQVFPLQRLHGRLGSSSGIGSNDFDRLELGADLVSSLYLKKWATNTVEHPE